MSPAHPAKKSFGKAFSAGMGAEENARRSLKLVGWRNVNGEGRGSHVESASFPKVMGSTLAWRKVTEFLREAEGHFTNFHLLAGVAIAKGLSNQTFVKRSWRLASEFDGGWNWSWYWRRFRRGWCHGWDRRGQWRRDVRGRLRRRTRQATHVRTAPHPVRLSTVANGGLALTAESTRQIAVHAVAVR